jgi:UDP-glucose 4-epimerase
MAQLDVRAYNIGTGVETSVLRLAEALYEAAGKRGVIDHLPARPGELARSSVMIDKAARELGWSPTVALLDGLKSTYEYFAARA